MINRGVEGGFKGLLHEVLRTPTLIHIPYTPCFSPHLDVCLRDSHALDFGERFDVLDEDGYDQLDEQVGANEPEGEGETNSMRREVHVQSTLRESIRSVAPDVSKSWYTGRR